ncbi:MAG: chromosome segregation protein SMC [Oscillospiraceae bacterium]
MFLKALEIQGFKSFPDRTRISFDKGITAVVGPNGSGKSNISDAIRWVMGETSVKQLRGGGKMENVIFGGTQRRGAMGFAAVHLILDNSDRRLDVEADEVTIGRKYYRSGESEYSVNGQSVRLKDVYELLLDTGLGRDGYSIIGQGRIAEIMRAKSSERREIFEEASGIARYRYRKNEAERRLSSAEDNLVRLRDILAELESRVGPLEKESAKAKKFLELSAERKSLEITLWVDTINDTRDTLRTQQRKIEVAQADYERKGEEIDALFAETQDVRAQIERIIVEIERANTDIRALQEELAGRDARVAVLRNDIEHNEASIASLQKEIEQSGLQAENISKEIATLEEAGQKATELLVAVRDKIAALEKRLADMQAANLASGERKGKIQADLAEYTSRITALRVEEAGAESAGLAAVARLADEQQEAAESNAELEKLLQEKADTEVLLTHTEETLEKLNNIRAGLALKQKNRTDALNAADVAERGAARELETAEQRLAMLRELESNLDGFQSSVKSVVKAGRGGRLRGILGPVSSLLSVKNGYEVAIETALGYSLQNIVVDGEAAAKAAMAYLKDNNAGRATFLPLDTVRPQRLDANLPAGAISAQTLVRFDPKFENIVSSLLARIVVVEDIHSASHVARTLNYRNRVVTRDGQVINAGGSFTGGSVSRSAGLFSRKQEMEELSGKMQQLKEKMQKAADETDRVKAEVDVLNAEMIATDSEIITAGGDKIRCDAEMSRLNQSVQARRNALQEAETACAQLLQEQKQSEEKRDNAKKEQQTLNAEIEILSVELESLVGEGDGFLTLREQLATQLEQLRLEALGYERDIEESNRSAQSLRARTGEGLSRQEELLKSISEIEQRNQENLHKIEEVDVEAGDKRGQIVAKEDEIKALSASRMEKEAKIAGKTTQERAFTAEREELGREVARLDEQKTSLENKYNGTIAQMWDEYELTPGDAEALCVEFTSVTELRRRVGELRGKIRALGNVNVGAVEEYEEVNERYTFLKKQVGDVEASKAELEKMIAELSAEMTAIFATNFAQINTHFGRIFVELFGGGRAELSLSDPENLLESGIEIGVEPPGKIIRDLTALSGGEQALIAICIYFAILAVNPAPFCVLDEIEAALDEVNVVRFAVYLRRISMKTQFIVITHRRGSMEEADVLYGVTMQEDGVSKLLRLNVADVDATLVQ